MASPHSRRVPLALTVGGALLDWAGTQGTVRVPFEHGVTVPRWRLHFRNINPRDGLEGRATFRVSQILIGESAGDGTWAAEPTLIAAELRGVPKRTQWQHIPLLAGREYLIEYTWVSDIPTRRVVGGGWTVRRSVGSPASLDPTPILPLDSWIEAEVPAATPVFAAFGDSLSSGVTAAVPVRDSWPSIYGRRIGALPMHYTSSGDTMKGWSNPAHYKWTRWADLTRPDFVIHAMGHNDIGNNAPIWDLQRRHLTTMGILGHQLTDRIHLASITPANSWSEEQVLTRLAYNHWLSARDPNMISFHTAIAPDDLRIQPDFDVDGTHLNTEGYRRMASVVPVFERPGVEAGHAAGGAIAGDHAAGSHLEPISLTRPLGNRTETLTSRSCRIPFSVPRDTRRWRVAIRNINFRSNISYTGLVRLRFLGYGLQQFDDADAPTSALEASPQEIARETIIEDASQEWTSPWVTEPLTAGTAYLLTLGYQTNGTEITLSMGAGWWTYYKPTNAEMTHDASAQLTRRMPFDIRVEVDEHDVEPREGDALIGDSISAGSDATFPVLEAPLASANRRRGAYTRLHSFGGASITEWTGAHWGNPFSEKWFDLLRYGAQGRTFLALGNNDIHAGTSAEALKAQYLQLASDIRNRCGSDIVACTVTPRASWTGTQEEETRQAFNDWLRSCPEGIDRCADTAQAVEDATGHAPHPDLVAVDGIHFNSAGTAAMDTVLRAFST